MNVPAKARWIGTVCFVGLVLVGCAAAGNSSDGSPEAGSDRNLITRAEMEGMEGLNAYEAIRRLRPAWLRPRGQAVLSGAERESLRVYLDRQIFGDLESLTNLMVRDIREIRYLDARQATLRFGTDHTLGAIVVITGGEFPSGKTGMAESPAPR